MTMIPLPPELESAVREAAALEGVSEELYVLGALQHELARSYADRLDGGLPPAWGPELARRDAEIVAGTERGMSAEDAFSAAHAALNHARAQR